MSDSNTSAIDPAVINASQVARHIARAAARLFATQGYDATSVRSIVEAAGVTKPTLYYYFGSKEGLAHALLTRPLDELLARLRDLLFHDEQPVAMLVETIEAHFDFCRDDPDRARFVYALFFGPLASGLAEETQRLGEALNDVLTDACAVLARKGLIAHERIEAFASACRGMIIVSTLDYLYKGKDLAPDLAVGLVEQLFNGFAAGGAILSIKERG